MVDDNTNYQQIVNKLRAEPSKDLYAELLSRESNTLDIVNRVIDHDRRKQIMNTSFLSMSFDTIYSQSLARVASLYTSLLTCKSVDDAVKLIKSDPLNIFAVGAIILFISLLLIFCDTAW